MPTSEELENKLEAMNRNHDDMLNDLLTMHRVSNAIAGDFAEAVKDMHLAEIEKENLRSKLDKAEKENARLRERLEKAEAAKAAYAERMASKGGEDD